MYFLTSPLQFLQCYRAILQPRILTASVHIPPISMNVLILICVRIVFSSIKFNCRDIGLPVCHHSQYMGYLHHQIMQIMTPLNFHILSGCLNYIFSCCFWWVVVTLV